MGKTIPSGGGMKNRTHKNNVQAIGTNLGKICRIIGFFFYSWCEFLENRAQWHTFMPVGILFRKQMRWSESLAIKQCGAMAH